MNYERDEAFPKQTIVGKIWKSVEIGLRKFRLVSADACGGGTCDCDESLREFAGKASENAVHGKKN